MIEQTICDICKRLYERGLIAGTDGNVSIRLNDTMYITPSGINKGFLKPDQIIRMDISNSEVISGDLPPSSESGMHIEVYKNRKDVGAVIHSHPPFLIGVVDKSSSIDKVIMPEVMLKLKRGPGYIDYVMPGTVDLARRVGEKVQDTDLVILGDHGVVVVGPDLEYCFDITDSMEHCARIFLARRLSK